MKEWTDWVKCAEFLDIDEGVYVKMDLCRQVENHMVLVEFLAKLSNLINILAARDVFEYFRPENTDEKLKITTKIESLDRVVRLIEELIPTDQKERFTDVRRSIARNSERTGRP